MSVNALEEDMDKMRKEMTVSELEEIVEKECDCCEYCTDCRFYDYCTDEKQLSDAIEDIINIAKEIKEEK